MSDGKEIPDLFPFFNGFTYRDILGGLEEGITRRDPSPVIRVGGTYYVWYSRTTQTAHGYTATIWYATSGDGFEWREKGQALARGVQGAFDEHAVFTPSILVADDVYYMSYTAVPEPFYNGAQANRPITPTAIGMARAESPNGPWERISETPILKISDDHSRFDSLRVDDTCFVKRAGQYLMYYKGRQWGKTPTETKMGVAIADHPEGPYETCAENPLVNGGHEVCCWPHGNGVAGLFCNVGEAGNSLQYSADGIHFETIMDLVPPQAPGPFRKDHFRDGEGPGITWGICMHAGPWPHLMRFDCDLRHPDF